MKTIPSDWEVPVIVTMQKTIAASIDQEQQLNCAISKKYDVKKKL